MTPPKTGLAWHSPNLAGGQTLTLSSPDFEHEGTIPVRHASTRAGGQNLSPALTWSPAPEGTAQLLLVIEDPDAPTPLPFIHCVALLGASLTGLGHGALGAGHGYLGPEPPKSHGPHRYVFQLFALGALMGPGGPAKPRAVLAAARGVLARAGLPGAGKRPPAGTAPWLRGHRAAVARPRSRRGPR